MLRRRAYPSFEGLAYDGDDHSVQLERTEHTSVTAATTATALECKLQPSELCPVSIRIKATFGRVHASTAYVHLSSRSKLNCAVAPGTASRCADQCSASPGLWIHT
jgi:hypothetical protein